MGPSLHKQNTRSEAEQSKALAGLQSRTLPGHLNGSLVCLPNHTSYTSAKSSFLPDPGSPLDPFLGKKRHSQGLQNRRKFSDYYKQSVRKKFSLPNQEITARQSWKPPFPGWRSYRCTMPPSQITRMFRISDAIMVMRMTLHSSPTSSPALSDPKFLSSIASGRRMLPSSTQPEAGIKALSVDVACCCSWVPGPSYPPPSMAMAPSLAERSPTDPTVPAPRPPECGARVEVARAERCPGLPPGTRVPSRRTLARAKRPEAAGGGRSNSGQSSSRSPGRWRKKGESNMMGLTTCRGLRAAR